MTRTAKHFRAAEIVLPEAPFADTLPPIMNYGQFIDQATECAPVASFLSYGPAAS
jgi:hypothetical protein